MITKNINFKDFNKKKLSNSKFKIKKFKRVQWTKKYPLLKSFTNQYQYSYKKKFVSTFNKFKKFQIIGMGGSILGTEAIYQFLSDKIKKEFYFVNNLQPLINTDKSDVNIVVSKSGETLETISNFHIILKRRKVKNIVITENSSNYLRKLASEIKAEIFDHKNYIGGRYSVLSEVGMLPAELMGLKEHKFKQLNYLIKNEKFIYHLIKNVEQTINFVKNKKNNSIILNYDERSDNLFKWYQQLIAESLGKKSKGLIPIISTMPKDNHSLMQLYLDGPKKNFFTFFNIKANISDRIKSLNIQKSKAYLKNKSLEKIIDAQRVATQNVFSKKKLNFRSIEVKTRSEESLGELFCFFVLETILLGKALNVNPFDQPSVELIKTETKKILK